MVWPFLRLLNPGRWVNSFACWWLGIDWETVIRHKLERQKLLSHSFGSYSSDKHGPSVIKIQVSAAASPSLQPCLEFDNGVDDAERQAWIRAVLPEIYRWDFNIFQLSEHTKGEPLFSVTLSLLESYDLLEGWKINRRKAENFVREVERYYKRTNPYHNNTHAADVTQTAGIILHGFVHQIKDFPKVEIFALILSAAVHDLAHPGVNNDFLINTRNRDALIYNDRSVNEMAHVSRAFLIALDDDKNIFEGMTKDEYKRVRHLVISMVLSTDMAMHFELLDKFNNEFASKPHVSDWQDRNLILQMILHLADLANPSRPFFLARRWAELVVTEFLQQGDQEEQLGMPVSPMCNRNTVCMPRAQLNFISIFLKPTLMACERVNPDFIHMALASLEETMRQWSELEKAGVR